MPVNLTDTTVLSNFSQIERPDLLRAVFPDLAAPYEVWEELSEGERLKLVPSCDWSWLRTFKLADAEQVHAAQLREHLQAGEAACIAVVASRGGLLLSDDAEARRIALSLEIEISGTIGVLDRLCQRAIIDFDQGNALLLAMIARGYRSPVRSLRQFPPES